MIFGEIALPSIMDDFGLALADVGDTWAPYFLGTVGTILIAVAGIYLAFVGWRAFRRAVNGV